MAEANERSPLLGSNTELSDTSSPRIYKKQNRGFHLCVLASFIIIVAIAAVATLWYLLQPATVTDNSSPVNDASQASPVNDANLAALLRNSWPRPDVKSSSSPYVSILALVNEAVDDGKAKLQTREIIESNSNSLPHGSPSYKHQKAIVYSPSNRNATDYGYIENEASKYLHAKGVHGVVDYASATDLKWTNESECRRMEENVTCNDTPYRSVDGSCNNKKHSLTWGVAMTPFRRSLPAEYEDGVSEPRGGFTTTLPSARDVSTQIHRPVYEQDDQFTVMLAVWGQFIDHDITATALSRGLHGESISCCDAKIQHPECFPVRLSPSDDYYSKYNVTCMEFVRSAPALRCSFGPREQLNQASSYLDASMVYGNTQNLTSRLRTFHNGELKMSYTKEGRSLLPVTTDPVDGCNQEEEIKKGRYCFLSGDSRANENMHLTSMHLILARQHNYIAQQLHKVNPSWNDETLYQETRRIVIAQIQHITYNEFLPSILGPDMMTKLKLYSNSEGYWTLYNDTIDASISNNFATSSFRFAHTLIPRMMKLLANDTSSPEYVEMHKMLFNPFGLYDGELDSILRGALSTPIEKADNHFTNELTEHLFESFEPAKSTKKPSYGLDLVALNIQRGRDHGLPGYTKWREYCGLSPVSTFEDLQPIFDEESFKTISSLYKSPDDIDLYTGSLSEYPIPGGLLGPTLTCLLSDQFFRLKYGDRFWYETNEQPQAFTPEQLNEIRKTTLAGVICQNADDLQRITPEVMRSSSETNKAVPCSQIAQPNLAAWRGPPEERHQLRVLKLQITSDHFNFTWVNGSSVSVSPRYFQNGRLDSVVAETTLFTATEVELRGRFSFVGLNDQPVRGVYKVRLQMLDGHFHIFRAEVKLPIYLANGTAEENVGTSRLILNTNRTSYDQFWWNGNVTVVLLPPTTHANASTTEINAGGTSYDQFWWNGNVTVVVLPPTTHANASTTEINAGDENAYGGIKSWTEYEAKTNDLGSYRNQTSLQSTDTTLIEDELRYLEQIPDASFIINSANRTSVSSPAAEKIYQLNITGADLVVERNGSTVSLPAELRYKELQDKVIIWNVSSSSPAKGEFAFGNVRGTFGVTRNAASMQDAPLSPACRMYSRILFEKPANDSDLFYVNVASPVNECSVTAPALLHGRYTSPETFRWDGNATVFLRQVESQPFSSSLEKEDELSLHLTPEQLSAVRAQTATDSVAEMPLILANDSSPLVRNVLYQIVQAQLRNSSVDGQLHHSGPATSASPTSSVYHVVVTTDDVRVKLNNGSVVSAPIQLPYRDLRDTVVSWNVDGSSNSPEGKFVAGNESGTFSVKNDSALVGNALLRPRCQMHSKILFETPANYSGLFYVDAETSSLGNCSAAAPILLHGRYISADTFLWNGSATVFLRPAAASEWRTIQLQNVTGLISISGNSLNVDVAAADSHYTWIVTNDTRVYPVFWSGVYDDANFVGNFLLPSKRISSLPYAGQFSVNLSSVPEPLNASVANLLGPHRVHQSVVYLTEDPRHVGDIDLSDFANIDNWDSSDYSRIVVNGTFVDDKFVPSGGATIVLPESTAAPKTTRSAFLQPTPASEWRTLQLPNVTGLISISENSLNEDDSSLPAPDSHYTWIVTNDTRVYPIFWSGVYDDANFEGNFLLPSKRNSSLPYDGQFSVSLSSVPEPLNASVARLLGPHRVHQSVVYLTENPRHVSDIDLSDFANIDNWDSSDYSRIVVNGTFVDDKFVPSGHATIVLPEPTAAPNTTSALRSYRPHGKYSATVTAVTLYAILQSGGPVLKWWSGVVPPTVWIPAGELDTNVYRKIFDDAILWSYDASDVADGHGTFRTRGNDSGIYLFGDFEFNVTSLLEGVNASALTPNTTYFSPLVFQPDGKAKRGAVDYDLVEDVGSAGKTEGSVFAPIMFLGEFVDVEGSTVFEWNLKCLITVGDEFE